MIMQHPISCVFYEMKCSFGNKTTINSFVFLLLLYPFIFVQTSLCLYLCACYAFLANATHLLCYSVPSSLSRPPSATASDTSFSNQVFLIPHSRPISLSDSSGYTLSLFSPLSEPFSFLGISASVSVFFLETWDSFCFCFVFYFSLSLIFLFLYNFFFCPHFFALFVLYTFLFVSNPFRFCSPFYLTVHMLPELPPFSPYLSLRISYFVPRPFLHPRAPLLAPISHGSAEIQARKREEAGR